MRKVIVGFSRPKEFKILAKLIMLSENTNFSHAYLRTESPTYERSLIYQASGKEVNFEGKIHFETHAIIVKEYEVMVSDEVYKVLMQFCIDNAAIPYGLKATIGLAWVKINKMFGKKIDNPFIDGDASLFCSELAYHCMNIVDPNSTEPDEDISPKDLNDILKINNIFKRTV